MRILYNFKEKTVGIAFVFSLLFFCKSHALLMHATETCGCLPSTLQVETPNGNIPVNPDGSVVLKGIKKGKMVSLESRIKGFWCPKYACKHLSGEWTPAEEGGTLKVVCLKKTLPSLPCFINIPKHFGWP